MNPNLIGKSRLVSVVITLIFSSIGGFANAAGHDLGCLISNDQGADIADVYAFPSLENPNNTVFIMTVNSAAGLLSPTTFSPNAAYKFIIDVKGRAAEKITFTFSKPNRTGQQAYTLKGKGVPTTRGRTGETTPLEGGGKMTAGLFDDPFFFDFNAFWRTSGRSFCDDNTTDFFAGMNVLAIVLEVPTAHLPAPEVGIWARTRGTGQKDRMGRPATSLVFIPPNPFEPNEKSLKEAFNNGKPRTDQKKFRGEIIDTLELFYTDPAVIDRLADFFLPDVLTFDTTTPPGFPNGRQLADDVMDDVLSLATGGLEGTPTIPTDCIDGNDRPLSTRFPYLALPHND